MIREILSIIFPYIVVLYVIDSLQYVRKPNVLFVSHFGKYFHLKTNGLRVAKLSPASTTVLSHSVPSCLASNGLYQINEEGLHDVFNFTEDSIRFLSYEDIDRIDLDGKNVNINGNTFIRAPSPITANIIKDQIKRIKTVKPEKRAQKIKEYLESALAVEKIQERDQLCAGDLFNLKLLCSFFFINTFMILPLILYTSLYFYINIYLIIAIMVLSYIIIVSFTFVLHKKIYKRERRQRLYIVLSMIFSPFSAAHATNYITNDLYSYFHYLAVAGILLSPEMFVNMTRKELAFIELRKSLIKDEDWIEYWEIEESALKKFLEKTGCSVEKVLSPPAKKDHGATCYCPICQAEYAGEIKYCSDCGIELKLF